MVEKGVVEKGEKGMERRRAESRTRALVLGDVRHVGEGGRGVGWGGGGYKCAKRLEKNQ